MQLRISRLTASGVPAVQKLNQEVLPFALNSTYYDRLAAHPNLSAMVFAEGDEPIGAITCRLLPDRSDALYIATLAVQEAYQHKGIGRMLVRHACSVAEGIELEYVDVHVWTESCIAHRFYLQLGFHELARVLRYYTSLEPPSAILMRRKITAAIVEW